MEKSKRSRAAVHNENCNGAGQIKPRCCADNIQLTQDIDHHWGCLPFDQRMKDFILHSSNGNVSLSKLIKCWSSPQNIQFTRGDLAFGICSTVWHLALIYLEQNMFKEAQALTINGSFLHQCYNSSIEYIISVAADGFKFLSEQELPYFIRGYSLIGYPDRMKAYIEACVPKDYTRLMTNFSHLSSKDNVMGIVDQISNDWNGASKNCRQYSPSGNDGAHKIKLILVDDANEAERHSFGIGSSTTLKALFNDYADKRGISLRSLRFSRAGKMLFLSSAGHKTPEELGMQDQDVIKVHDISDSNSTQTRCSTFSSSHTKSKAKRSKNAKKGKNKKPQQHQEEHHVKTLEEHKVEHSKRLDKIHDEAQAQFKQIRQRLNNLVIERSQRKVKSKCQHSPKLEPSLPSLVSNPSKKGLGGKSGKSCYEIQVGEVQYLYKTSKPSALAGTTLPLPSLDLHGCTRDEALTKLDESLKVWADMAMKGSYPFVQPAVIVCGCGNQILSEAVQDWIRSNDKVSNAPKARSSRGRMV